MKIIVVGNGPIRSNQGPAINLFHTIVRCSNFKIEGYEHLVGTKTDVVAVSKVEVLRPMPPIVWATMGCAAVPERAMQEAYPNGYHGIGDEAVKDCYSLLPDGVHPTLGLQAIMNAVHCGRMFYELPVVITGFSFGHVGHPYGYFNSEEFKPCRPGTHDPSAERKAVKEMINRGMVAYLNPVDIFLLEEF